MRIGEISRLTGIGARMLRYYEDEGLLTPERRANGYREYSESDAARVRTIRDLRAAGVPTRFIRIVLDRQDSPDAWSERCDEIIASMVREQIAELESRIDCLTTSKQALARFVREQAPAASR
ncbi:MULTISPECIES: MerR family transcriptional regulator [unclassified Leucobacter]|uniref:MerR family transcriptional regulator n=1 Tax=unclassified Leucobacter TaxID=2621730 RepID=UPI0030163400